MPPIGFEDHNHSRCIDKGVALAQRTCDQKKLQLTPVRKRVLEILLEKHQAMGAYEILDILRQEGLGSQPPVAYRALDFLVTHGFAHKIEQLNAFVACSDPTGTHVPAFLICKDCHAVAESAADPARGALAKVADAAGFQIERSVIEAEGLCPNCRLGDPA